MSLHYETVCIVDPDIGAEAVKGFIEKATSIVEKHEGVDIVVDDWGRRKLAYPIRKKNDGHYILFTYTAAITASKELERICKIDEDVVRYQSVRLDKREPIEEEKPAEEKPAEEVVAAAAAETTEATAAPAPEKAAAAPAPEKVEAAPAPEKAEAAPVPEKVEAAPVPEKAEASETETTATEGEGGSNE